MGYDDYTYHIHREDNWSSKNATPEELAFDKLPASVVKTLVARAAASDAERNAADQFQIDEQVFRKLYPSYKNTPRNAQLMKHHWENTFGTEIPSLAQIEESFLALRESGVIQLDAKEVAKEDAAAIAQRADELRAQRKTAEFDEADAYTMPLEELRRRSNAGW